MSKIEEKLKTGNGQKMSAKEKLEFAVFHDADISKDQISTWLQNDIRGVYLLLSEVLASRECLDALVDVFYKRYLKFHEDKKNNPELDLKKEAEGYAAT